MFHLDADQVNGQAQWHLHRGSYMGIIKKLPWADKREILKLVDAIDQGFKQLDSMLVLYRRQPLPSRETKINNMKKLLVELVDQFNQQILISKLASL